LKFIANVEENVNKKCYTATLVTYNRPIYPTIL